MTYKDVYKLPVINHVGTPFVFDSDNNVLFQFLTEDMKFRERVVKTINGDYVPEMKNLFFIQEDKILIKNTVPATELILVRGWGNLTGIGAMNLTPKEAINIQDTLLRFVVSKLNG